VLIYDYAYSKAGRAGKREKKKTILYYKDYMKEPVGGATFSIIISITLLLTRSDSQ
jgi:hypothetical protein